MIFLHDSVKTDYFKDDKKLNLLNRGVITPAQFVNLIDVGDEYLMIGPAIVAKNSIPEFISEWKMHQLNMDAVHEAQANLSQDEIIKMIEDVIPVFSEIHPIFIEFKNQLNIATCAKCVKNRYISAIVEKIKELKEDGRDVSSVEEKVNALMNHFYPSDSMSTVQALSEYDNNWMKSEKLVGLGDDLVKNLGSCFECTIKHIGRAKALFEEFVAGYPDHGKMMFDELEKGGEPLEKAYLIYMDSMSQLDMASCELVGDIIDLPIGWQADILELANKIRAERLLCQEDNTKIPDFDGLRIAVKKLELKTKTALENEKF